MGSSPSLSRTVLIQHQSNFKFCDLGCSERIHRGSCVQDIATANAFRIPHPYHHSTKVFCEHYLTCSPASTLWMEGSGTGRWWKISQGYSIKKCKWLFKSAKASWATLIAMVLRVGPHQHQHHWERVRKQTSLATSQTYYVRNWGSAQSVF